MQEKKKKKKKPVSFLTDQLFVKNRQGKKNPKFDYIMGKGERGREEDQNQKKLTFFLFSMQP